jgi:hypothetical protein
MFVHLGKNVAVIESPAVISTASEAAADVVVSAAADVVVSAAAVVVASASVVVASPAVVVVSPLSPPQAAIIRARTTTGARARLRLLVDVTIPFLLLFVVSRYSSI